MCLEDETVMCIEMTMATGTDPMAIFKVKKAATGSVPVAAEL